MGMSLAEYERSVGELNKEYHETAEIFILQGEGILPLRDDEDELDQSDMKSDAGKKAIRRSRRQ